MSGGLTHMSGGLTLVSGGLTLMSGGLTLMSGGLTLMSGGLTLMSGGLTLMSCARHSCHVLGTHVRWFDTNTTNRWLLLLLGCLHCLIFHSSGLVCGKPRCLLLRHSGSRCLGPRTSSRHPWAPSGGGAFPRLGELGVSRETGSGGRGEGACERGTARQTIIIHTI